MKISTKISLAFYATAFVLSVSAGLILYNIAYYIFINGLSGELISQRTTILNLLNKLKFLIIIIIAPIPFIAWLIGTIVAGYITRPLYKLQKGAELVGKGVLDFCVDIHTNDELGEVSRSFDNMLKNLKEISISKNYLNSVIESMADFLIVTYPNGVINSVNHSIVEKSGYTREELLGKELKFLFPDKDLMGEGKLPGTINDELTVNYETFCVSKSNSTIPILLNTSVIKAADGTITNIVFIARDISNRKKAAAEIEEKGNEMEKANISLKKNERALKAMMYDMKKTHDELKNVQAQLVQSEKLASLGQLSAGVAHEINNPLGFVSNNIEMLEQYIESYSQILRALDVLKNSVLDKDLNKADSIVKQINELEEKVNFSFITSDIDNLIRQSKSGTERIKKIVQDLRTFARKDEGQMELNNIEDILEGVINIVWNEIKYKAELKKEYGNVPLVKCNPQKIGQVFINLLVNASQAIKEKGIITVRTYKKEKAVCVEISDTGTGILKEDLDKIFDPFFTTKEVGKGTGLGLSIGYEIVKKHNGQMTVVSEMLKGTTFTVSLPI